MAAAVERRKGELVALLGELVGQPSVEGSPALEGCHRIVGAQLAALGIEPQILRFGGLPVTLARVGAARSAVMFAGHLDVVPALGRWRTPPFELTVEGTTLSGRGVADMKGGVAAFVGALQVLADLGALDRVGVELVLTSDEEVGSACGMIPFLAGGHSEAVAAVCAEPTALGVFHGNRGVAWVTVRITGHGGHAGQAHLLSNPVPVAARVISAIEALQFEVSDGRFDPPVPSAVITRVRAATDATNVVPDWVELAIDRRLLPAETLEHALGRIERTVRTAVPSAFEVEVRVDHAWPPYVIDPARPIVKAAMAAVAASGIAPRLGTDQAANDSSWLSEAGITPVLLGPGSPGAAHGTDESISIDQLLGVTQAFVHLALAWPNVEARSA